MHFLPRISSCSSLLLWLVRLWKHHRYFLPDRLLAIFAEITTFCWCADRYRCRIHWINAFAPAARLCDRFGTGAGHAARVRSRGCRIFKWCIIQPCRLHHSVLRWLVPHVVVDVHILAMIFVILMAEVFCSSVMVLGLIYSARGTNYGVRGRQGRLLAIIVL